jgi:hypothetical protein
MGLTTVLAVLPVAAWAHTVGIEGDAALARGFNMSVLFLLSMPVAIVAVLFGTVYLAQKRAQRQGRPGLAGTQTAHAHRQSSRQVLRILAYLFFD